MATSLALFYEPPENQQFKLEGVRVFMAMAVAALLSGSAPPLDQCRSAGAIADSFADIVLVGSSSAWRCSGTLVAPDFVLTARHCLPLTRIGVGADAAETLEVRRVIRTITPEDERLDVALLQLSTPLPVRPRAIADEPPGGAVLRVAGFGSVDASGRFGFGRFHVADLAEQPELCTEADATRLGCLPGAEFVLRSASGKDTCDGDSGGPVLKLVPARNGCVWKLVGITSRPIAGARVRCGAGGVYVASSALLGFVNSVITPSAPK